MILQAITDVVELCSRKGISRAIISPGSRNAPLTLAFARHPKIETFVIPDERSAGFIALGMSQKLHVPVALICTSGSAVYNYAPAVAEAFYANVPLIVLSADRPPEWIDQRDGQTIRQQGIFGNHVRGSFQLPDLITSVDNLWFAQRTANEAINLACGRNPGPVHINVPLREPFYPDGELPEASSDMRVVENFQGSRSWSDNPINELKDRLNNYEKVLIVAGQSALDSEAIGAMRQFSHDNNIPIVTDIISNFNSLDHAIIHQDLFLGLMDDSSKKRLQPDLVLSFGQSVISKNLKLYLRKFKPKEHWHIAETEYIPDTMQSLTKVVDMSIIAFCKSLHSTIAVKSESYAAEWAEIDNKSDQFLEAYSTDKLWELPIVSDLLEALPANTQLHLANSMPVRWANFVNTHRTDVEVFANRGTSGIDGCLSVAVGCALSCQSPVVALMGDMAFLYDRNGLWHNYLPENLRILVINNHGGGIFRLIEGPSQQPELEEFFETQQRLHAKNTINDYDIDYLKADSIDEYKAALKDFLKMEGKAKLMEVEVNSENNKTELEVLKQGLKAHLNA